MSPIQVSAIRTSTQPHPSDWETVPPARSGIALPYLEHATLRALGCVSKHDRARLEKRLATKTASKIVTAIASMGANTPLYPSFFSGVTSEIAALDQRVAASLWQRLEDRFIYLAANDIDVCAEAEKGSLLEKLIELSKHNLPADVQGRVLADLISVVNRTFNDPDATCTALCGLFEHCRELPLPQRDAPLRNLLLSMPYDASNAFKPQISQLIDAMKREIRLLAPEKQSIIEHDMLQANTAMEDFFASFMRVTKLPQAERHASMSTLIERMLTVEHNSADPIITSTLRFFSSQPHMMSAEMLADLVPMVSLIPNLNNRAGRLRMLVQLSDAFAADTRAPLLKNIAGVAASLSESDRKRILGSLYLSVSDMNGHDKLDVVHHANALGATLPVVELAEVVVTLPATLQQLVQALMRVL